MQEARLASEKAEAEPEKQDEESEEDEGEQTLAKVKVENVAKIVVEDDFDIDDI